MNNRGLTIVEVIVVMAVMTIVLAIAAPSMISWRSTATVKEVAQDILGGLRQARSLAVADNQNVTATLNLDDHKLTYGSMTRNLAADIKLEADNDNSLLVATTSDYLYRYKIRRK